MPNFMFHKEARTFFQFKSRQVILKIEFALQQFFSNTDSTSDSVRWPFLFLFQISFSSSKWKKNSLKSCILHISGLYFYCFPHNNNNACLITYWLFKNGLTYKFFFISWNLKSYFNFHPYKCSAVHTYTTKNFRNGKPL